MYGARSAWFVTRGDLSDWWIQETAAADPKIKTDRPDVNRCVSYLQGVYAGGFITQMDLAQVRGGVCWITCFVKRALGRGRKGGNGGGMVG